MKASDIMSAPVITIAPQTPVRQIATLLEQHHISGVPVVADGKVVGLVNEAELLRRYEIGTESSAPARSWLEQLFERDLAALDYVKSHAQNASDVMTRKVFSVDEETPVQKLASILGSREVRRIVVMRGETLVGIVTRGNLVQAMLRNANRKNDQAAPSDEAIRVRLVAELEQQPWWRPGQSAVSVQHGIVQFRGLIENESERRAARIAAENLAGVHGVEDQRRHWTSLNTLY